MEITNFGFFNTLYTVFWSVEVREMGILSHPKSAHFRFTVSSMFNDR